MKYILTLRSLGKKNQLEISLDRFNDIRQAKELLLHALYLEEKFDLVQMNYADFERQLLDQALNQLIYTTVDWSDFVGGINDVNLRIVNLLSTCRLYLDQTVHHLHEMYGEGSAVEISFKKLTNNSYDGVFGYRFLEAMRNYVQHRGFPVHAVTVGSKLDATKGASAHSVTPFAKIDSIREDKKFKATILEEMEKHIDKKGRIDLRPAIRDYVSSIGKIHRQLRADIQTHCETAEQTLQAAIEDYQRLGDEDIVGLAAVVVGDKGREQDHVQIFMDFVNLRKKLATKNPCIMNLADHYVCNSLKNDA